MAGKRTDTSCASSVNVNGLLELCLVLFRESLVTHGHGLFESNARSLCEQSRFKCYKFAGHGRFAHCDHVGLYELAKIAVSEPDTDPSMASGEKNGRVQSGGFK